MTHKPKGEETDLDGTGGCKEGMGLVLVVLCGDIV